MITTSSLFFIMFIMIVLLFMVIVSLYIKVRNLEAKLLDVTPQDLYPFIEEMRELVIESELIAEKLDGAINEKEDALEDLIDLASARIAELKEYDIEIESGDTYKPAAPQQVATEQSVSQPTEEIEKEPEPSESPIKTKILNLSEEGFSEAEIAKKLGISTTEVKIVLSLNQYT